MTHYSARWPSSFSVKPPSETAPCGLHAWITQDAFAKGIVHPPEVLGPNQHPDAGAYQHDDPAGPWVPGCTFSPLCLPVLPPPPPPPPPCVPPAGDGWTCRRMSYCGPKQSFYRAAALSLAGIGPDRTMLQIWADPGVDRNIHTITVEADSARFTMTIENIPSDENPKTGKITALSMLATLRRLTAPLVSGT